MTCATRTHNHGVSADEYINMLQHARDMAAKHRPDVKVSAVQRHDGVWHAVTTGGVIAIRDLNKPVEQE